MTRNDLKYSALHQWYRTWTNILSGSTPGSLLPKQRQLLSRVLFASQNSTLNLSLNLSKTTFLKPETGWWWLQGFLQDQWIDSLQCVIKGPLLMTFPNESMFRRWVHFCFHHSRGLRRPWGFGSLKLQKPWYPGLSNKTNPFPDVSSGRTGGSLITNSYSGERWRFSNWVSVLLIHLWC